MIHKVMLHIAQIIRFLIDIALLRVCCFLALAFREASCASFLDARRSRATSPNASAFPWLEGWNRSFYGFRSLVFLLVQPPKPLTPFSF